MCLKCHEILISNPEYYEIKLRPIRITITENWKKKFVEGTKISYIDQKQSQELDWSSSQDDVLTWSSLYQYW